MILVFAMFFITIILLQKAVLYAPDFVAHIKWIEQIDLFNLKESLMLTPASGNPLLHIITKACSQIFAISVKNSLMIIIAVLNTLSFIITREILKKYIKKLSIYVVDLLAFSLMFFTAIYVFWVNSEIYYGQFFGTTWHNPTTFAIKTISLLTLYLYISLYEDAKNNKLNMLINAKFVFAFLTMCLGLLIKPSFAQTFLPAMVVFLVVLLIIEKKKINKLFLIESLMILAVSGILLAFQFFWIFVYDEVGQSRGVGISFLHVIKNFTPNVTVSIISSIIFPVFVLATNFKTFLENKVYLLVWLVFLFGMAQGFFLYDNGGGDSAGFGDYIWGYVLSSFFIMIASVVVFFNNDLFTNYNKTNFSKVYVIVGVVILCMYFISGYCYYVQNVTLLFAGQSGHYLPGFLLQTVG